MVDCLILFGFKSTNWQLDSVYDKYREEKGKSAS